VLTAFDGEEGLRSARDDRPDAIVLDLQLPRVNGVDVDLTKREFDLLAVLAEHKTAVLSRAQLLELVWGYDFAADTNVVDVFIGYLRRKLEAGGGPRLLHTVRGVGFVLRMQ